LQLKKFNKLKIRFISLAALLALQSAHIFNEPALAITNASKQSSSNANLRFDFQSGSNPDVFVALSKSHSDRPNKDNTSDKDFGRQLISFYDQRTNQNEEVVSETSTSSSSKAAQDNSRSSFASNPPKDNKSNQAKDDYLLKSRTLPELELAENTTNEISQQKGKTKQEAKSTVKAPANSVDNEVAEFLNSAEASKGKASQKTITTSAPTKSDLESKEATADDEAKETEAAFKSSKTFKDDSLEQVNFGDNLTASDRAQFEGDSIDYDPDTEVFVINGNAVIYLRKQNTKIAADKIEYYQKDSLLKAYGNVMVTAKDQVTYSKYMEVELEEDKATFEEIISQKNNTSIIAEDAVLQGKGNNERASYTNGHFELAQPIRLGHRSRNASGLASQRFEQILNTPPEEILAEGQSFTLSADNIKYDNDKIQNNLFLSGARLRFKKSRLTIPIPFLLLTAGNSDVQMFGMVAGNNPRTGAGDFNLGPKFSFVLGDPEKERSISLAPFFQLGNGTGFGGMLEYLDPRNHAMIGYGSSKERGIAQFTSKLTKHNNFRYGWNSYLGGGITKQFLQLNDIRSIKIPVLTSFMENESLYSASDLTYALDSNRLRLQENNRLSDLQRDSLGNDALRERDALRLQQTFSFTTKPIVEFGTKNYNTGLRIISSSTARIYSTGNINAFSSFGPNLKIHLHKYADLEAGYNQLVTTGKSPFGFDQVIQGQSSVYVNGDINFTRWFSLGGQMVYSLSRKDTISQQIRAIVGPPDFKVLLSYDPIVNAANLGFSMLFDDKVNFRRFRYQGSKNGRKRRF
jgi:lipopolysaccharide export system protein LptA